MNKRLGEIEPGATRAGLFCENLNRFPRRPRQASE